MKKHHQMLSILLVFIIFDTNLVGTQADQARLKKTNKVSYLQLSDSKNQLGRSTPQAIKYNNIDGLNRANVYKNGSFTSNNAGIYFILLAIQIGSPKRNGEGNIHVWERLGAQDIPASNSIQTIKRGSMSVLVYQTVYEDAVSDVTTLIFSAFTTDKRPPVGLISTARKDEPVAPSVKTSNIQISDASKLVPYTQLTSSVTQLGDMTSKAVIFNGKSAENRIDTTTIGKDGTIKYTKAGIYFIITNAEAGSAINTDAFGQVYLGIHLNEKDVPNTNRAQTVRNGSITVMTTQAIVNIEAGDKVKLMFSTTNKNLGLIFLSPENEPTILSVILSTFWLGSDENSVAYAQLSSSETQWGGVSPTIVELGSNDGSRHIKNHNGIIKFSEPGTYYLMATAQVGSYGDQGVGDVHLWLRLNKKDIENSNTIQTVNKDTSILVTQTVVVIREGDQVQVVFSTRVSKGKLGLVASQPENGPAVPSIIVSAFKSSFPTPSKHHPKRSEE